MCTIFLNIFVYPVLCFICLLLCVWTDMVELSRTLQWNSLWCSTSFSSPPRWYPKTSSNDGNSLERKVPFLFATRHCAVMVPCSSNWCVCVCQERKGTCNCSFQHADGKSGEVFQSSKNFWGFPAEQRCSIPKQLQKLGNCLKWKKTKKKQKHIIAPYSLSGVINKCPQAPRCPMNAKTHYVHHFQSQNLVVSAKLQALAWTPSELCAQVEMH